jgi:hypothetical protein
VEIEPKRIYQMKGSIVYISGKDKITVTKKKDLLLRFTAIVNFKRTVFHLDFSDKEERDGVYNIFTLERAKLIIDYFKSVEIDLED